MKTRRYKTVREDRESDNSMTQQSELPAEDGRTKGTKRKASPPEEMPTRKRTKLFERGSQNCREENLCRILSERNLREDSEGQSSGMIKRSSDEDDTSSSSSSVDTSGESDNSMTQQSELPADDGRTKGPKRKASPDEMPTRKRTKLSEPGSQNYREENLCRRLLERNLREDREGQSPGMIKRSLDEDDTISSSSSVDISGESSSNLSDSCYTSQEDVSEREAIAAGAGLSGKRTRRSYLKVTRMGTKKEVIKETEKEAVKETIKKSKPNSREVDALRAEFQGKYQQQNLLGAGGCGSVFAGYRRADELPVAIKYIPKDLVLCKHVDKNGRQLSVEVAIMSKLAGMSAPVSLLDWYDLDLELILVMERPVPAVDLSDYIEVNGGSLSEEEAKIIMKQLVDAAKELENESIFHRDIKVENILIETGSDVPRVRLIDFGLGCFVTKRSVYRVFYGTIDHVPPEWKSHCTYRSGPSTVWQMGVVLYDSLHGIAFETTEFLKKKLRIKNKLSKDCQDFLQSCLTEDPKQRPTLDQLRLHPWLN